MADYNIYLYNVLTQTVTASVPASALSYGYTMDAAGTASIEIPIGVPKKNGSPLTQADLFPVVTGVAIERDGVLVWGGLVWAYAVDLSKRTITVTAQGYLSYFAKRNTNPTAGATYKNVEQTAMIKTLITSLTNGLKTDTAGIVPTNMVRTRTWNPYEIKALDEIFADLADDITAIVPATGIEGGGFFLYFDPYWITQGTKIGNRVWNTTNRHPQGVGKSLQQGVNCEFTNITLDGTGLANQVYAVGATDGTASITPYATGTSPALLAKIPTVNLTLSETSISQGESLQYKVKSALAFGSIPIILPQASTYPNLFSPLDLRPGTLAEVTTDDGFMNLLDEEYVVTESSVTVADDGSDRVGLTLCQAALFHETDDN